jgi:hypothetical protein
MAMVKLARRALALILIIALACSVCASDAQMDSTQVRQHIVYARERVARGVGELLLASLFLGVGLAVRPRKSSGPFTAEEAHQRDIGYAYSSMFCAISLPVVAMGGVTITVGCFQLSAHTRQMRTLQKKTQAGAK